MPNNNKNNYEVNQYGVLIGGPNNTITSLAPTVEQKLLAFVGNTTNPAFIDTYDGPFTFGASASGVTRTLTISNTSNTASSNAKSILTINNASTVGSSAARTNYTISGIRNYSAGMDNTDAGKFKITLTTDLLSNTAFSSTVDGEITTPLQSTFLAYRSTNVANATGNTVLYTCIFDNELYDLNSDYNPANGTFTAPVTGRYLLTSSYRVSGLTATNKGYDQQIQTSNRQINQGRINPGACANVDGKLTLCHAILCDMDAADTATMQIRVYDGTQNIGFDGDATDLISFFAGRLLA